MELDIRCSALWPDCSTELDDGRCQLQIGHEPPHAVVVAVSGARELWLWRGATTSKFDTHEGLPQQLAWSPGMPTTTRAVTRLTASSPTPARKRQAGAAPRRSA